MRSSLRVLEIPVLSIGAGPHCDGQLLIVSDMIGQFQAFTPKFVKKYCNVAEMITHSMKDYVSEVKSVAFPDEEQYCYQMVKGEEAKFLELMKQSSLGCLRNSSSKPLSRS